MNTNPQALLRDANLRVTNPRVAVLEFLAHNGHATADEVRAAVTERLGKVSTQAIYDILHAFTNTGIVRMIEPAGSVALYEVSEHDNHHHLICRSCYTIVDIACVVGRAPCLTPDDAHGFLIDEAEVIFWGYCPECRSLATAAAAAKK